MAGDEEALGPDDLHTPFLFVPHGDPDPVDWKADHPDWISFPAVMVPREPAEPEPPAAREPSDPLDDRGDHDDGPRAA